jgi:hypothetical protein
VELTSQHRFSGLALMSIEWKVLKFVVQHVTFCDFVVEVLDQKSRIIDLKYKQKCMWLVDLFHLFITLKIPSGLGVPLNETPSLLVVQSC